MPWQKIKDKPILSCRICQQSFIQQRWNQVCCSEACMKENRRLTLNKAQRRWIATHKDHIKQKNDTYQKLHREEHKIYMQSYNKKVKDNAKLV